MSKVYAESALYFTCTPIHSTLSINFNKPFTTKAFRESVSSPLFEIVTNMSKVSADSAPLSLSLLFPQLTQSINSSRPFTTAILQDRLSSPLVCKGSDKSPTTSKQISRRPQVPCDQLPVLLFACRSAERTGVLQNRAFVSFLRRLLLFLRGLWKSKGRRGDGEDWGGERKARRRVGRLGRGGERR